MTCMAWDVLCIRNVRFVEDTVLGAAGLIFSIDLARSQFVTACKCSRSKATTHGLQSSAILISPFWWNQVCLLLGYPTNILHSLPDPWFNPMSLTTSKHNTIIRWGHTGNWWALSCRSSCCVANAQSLAREIRKNYVWSQRGAARNEAFAKVAFAFEPFHTNLICLRPVEPELYFNLENVTFIDRRRARA